jgi:hypothetical protein
LNSFKIKIGVFHKARQDSRFFDTWPLHTLLNVEANKFIMDRTAKIIVAIVVIIASGFLIYSKLVGWHKTRLEKVVALENQMWQNKTGKMREEIELLNKELAEYKGEKAPDEKLQEVFGNKSQDENETIEGGRGAVAQEKTPQNFAEIEEQIKSIFDYLDEQSYVKSFKLKESTYFQYQIAIKKLSAKLPVVTGEMTSLINIVRNVAHFYRVLGKKRVLLIKEMLQKEDQVIEQVMKTFYMWFTLKDDGKSRLKGRPSMLSMYEYAGYILNTLGGRSYLLRRNPKVRTLTTYYCVLVLDKANDEELNSRGIDIRPYINSSSLEIQNQVGLAYQKEYLTKLDELRLKYYPN